MHKLFIHHYLVEILNLQENKGKAKAYQVKQVRQIIIDNGLDIKEDE